MDFGVIPEKKFIEIKDQITDSPFIYIKIVGVGPKTINSVNGNTERLIDLINGQSGHIICGNGSQDLFLENLRKIVDNFFDKWKVLNEKKE